MPFGGTSGLPNLVPADVVLAAVEPPLMNWSGNLTLSSATAFTTSSGVFSWFAVHGSLPALTRDFIRLETVGSDYLS